MYKMYSTASALVALAAITLTGCASTGMSEAGEVAYYEAQREAAKQRPLFEMECPASGCVVSSLKVNNPNQNSVDSAPVHTPWADLGQSFIGAAVSVAPWAAVSNIAVQGIKSANGATTNTDVRGDTFGNEANVAGGDVTGDYSGQNSGNSGRVESPDAVSEPTVVEQPAPVVE